MKKAVHIPEELVKQLLRAGLSKKDVYRVLVAQGYLRYGNGRVLSYQRFLLRLKHLEEAEATGEVINAPA